MKIFVQTIRNIIASFIWLIALGITQIGNWIIGRKGEEPWE